MTAPIYVNMKPNVDVVVVFREPKVYYGFEEDF